VHTAKQSAWNVRSLCLITVETGLARKFLNFNGDNVSVEIAKFEIIESCSYTSFRILKHVSEF
jgi:hypothetical protein